MRFAATPAAADEHTARVHLSPYLLRVDSSSLATLGFYPPALLATLIQPRTALLSAAVYPEN